MDDREFQQLYRIIDDKVEMASKCFYMELAFQAASQESDAMLAALNKHAEFWRVHRYALQSTFFITLGTESVHAN